MMSSCPGGCHCFPGTLDSTEVVKTSQSRGQHGTHMSPPPRNKATIRQETPEQHCRTQEDPRRACHRSYEAGIVAEPGREAKMGDLYRQCVCAQSGHQETQSVLWSPTRVQAVEASVSLLIKWKQAFYLVSLAGEGGKQAVIISQV